MLLKKYNLFLLFLFFILSFFSTIGYVEESLASAVNLEVFEIYNPFMSYRQRISFSLSPVYSQVKIVTKESQETSKATFMANSQIVLAEVAYALGPAFSLKLNYIIPFGFSDSFQISGYQVGLNYHLMQSINPVNGKLHNLHLSVSPLYQWLVYGLYSGRNYQFTYQDYSFRGYAFGTTYRRYISENYYILFDLQQEYLKYFKLRDSNSTSLSTGLGFLF